MEKKLVMSFKDQSESKFNFIVKSVKDDVSEEEINAIMDLVISTGAIVSKNGAMVKKLSAVVVETTETEYDVE